MSERTHLETCRRLENSTKAVVKNGLRMLIGLKWLRLLANGSLSCRRGLTFVLLRKFVVS